MELELTTGRRVLFQAQDKARHRQATTPAQATRPDNPTNQTTKQRTFFKALAATTSSAIFNGGVGEVGEKRGSR